MNKNYKNDDFCKNTSDENQSWLEKKSDSKSNQNNKFTRNDSDSEEYENQKVFNENEEIEIRNSSTNKDYSALKIYWKRYRYFIDSPRVHFVYETFFYSIFLALFSFMLLCEFEYYQKKPQTNTRFESTKNSTNYINEKLAKDPSYSEYVIIFWWVMYVIEELRQVIFFY